LLCMLRKVPRLRRDNNFAAFKKIINEYEESVFK
jgi:hypothetical protein